MSKFIELSSSNRNREEYPLVSYFEVPFAPTDHCRQPNQSVDPIVNATIYYKFTLYPDNTILASGTMQSGSGPRAVRLDPTQQPEYSQVPNFYKGYTFVDVTTSESHIVRSYNPQNGFVTFEKPFTTITAGGTYNMFIGFATRDWIFIPTVDDNGNPINTNELAYNGYYVIFESYDTAYSNADNSNIFYRQISYYDNVNQLAYFSEPLPFDLSATATDPLRFTLRKTLPLARWELDAPSFVNRTPPANPAIGPLVGPVIQLPATAPSEDNIYKGRYVYFANNAPDFFSPPLPAVNDLVKPIPYVFYPIYGAYYVRAYNGTTKQLSVENDINNIPLPSYRLLPYDSASFAAGNNVSAITNVGGTTYRADLTPSGPGPTYNSVLFLTNDSLYQRGRTYEIVWRARTSTTIVSASFAVPSIIDYTSNPPLANFYQTYTFRFIPGNGDFSISIDAVYNPIDAVYIEWDLFEMRQIDEINITTFARDNFSPLFYSGTMVGMNEAVCYDISLASLSLPNLPLKTGSTVAFYPFLYVLLENVTSPSSASGSVIYSNNPNTARALFIAPCYPTSDPAVQDYITLSSSTYHTIKFKPNDNLRFAVYLADGQLFQPLIPDLNSPYESRPRDQITAVFSIYRNLQGK
jgi:hypothetical protein